MNDIGPTFITIVTAVIGLAMLAVIVSRRAQTPQVVSAGGAALAQVIGAAVSPLGNGNDGATNFGTASSTTLGGVTL